ncbi:GAF domain-containing sensor histidine kinase [Lysinibacillus fusiformis]|nr:GAF domain-containing sensor histidine kinase [Lysinibacillus fusiformis]
MINISEFQVRQFKPLNECYFVVNRETLQIIDSNIANCSLYELLIVSNSTNCNEQANSFEIFSNLIESILKELNYNLEEASSLEIQYNNHSTLEVKFYPIDKNLIFIIKDKTKHVQVSDIIEENDQKISILTEISDQKLSILNEISEDIIKFHEPKKMLDSLFERLSSLLDLDFYFNYFLDSSKEQIRLINYHGIPKKTAESINILQFGEAICGTVAKIRKKIIAENVDTSDDPKVQLIKSWNIKAYICHPLFSHGKLLGTLSFGSSKRSTFSPFEVELIGRICNQVATSLERVFLIAKLKETNRVLITTNQQLLTEKDRADKANNAKTNFLMLMSHELRTPLNSIMGYNQLLLTTSNSTLTNIQKEQLEKMFKASKTLNKMISDMLEYVRYDNVSLTFDIKKIDIKRLIGDCIQDVAFLAKSNKISIEYVDLFNNTDIGVYSDPQRLKQVINNLLTNAIKYNNSNGIVRIISNVINKDLIIEFHDTGKGIKEIELDEIFKPFYRSPSNNPTIEGSGIGLSLSKQIVNELGGSLTVTSLKDVGSTFTIKLQIN